MKLKRETSIVFLLVYGVITVAARFYFEMKFNVDFLTSFLLGVSLLGALGLLFKMGFLTLNKE
ncbi:hypothetical protein FNH22_24860 [Fulvivirga sp. M361]|uniref:hypothetical protein n=1 Tax=Fulvivirga sp. M361 TaxID=2594266 RepID=UPI00117BD5F1|nr:hypothetical protein [Fulvivirga sp. M361]TRX50886.1 hypothetical protein FNH22_24860 [Fulvivirga sp. M361]